MRFIMLPKRLTQSMVATALALPIIALSSQKALAADSFGAIAYSPATKVHGYSYRYRTRQEAVNAAVAACVKTARARDCKLLVWFKNACGALAENPVGTYGYAWAGDRQTAEAKAVQACQDYGGDPCRITRWVCSF